MNVLDLFSGIGGFSLGLERAGMRTVVFCEIDEYCRGVLRTRWPTVPIHFDIRTLTRSHLQWVHGASDIDVICGGFPCQDISSAGGKVGIRGIRSGLWREYARLVGEIRPRYVVVENVSDLLSRGLGVVLGDLAALGYDAEWHCIPASAVGAPHRRDRVWIVANSNRDGQPRGAKPDLGSLEPKFQASLRRDIERLRSAVPDADGAGCHEQIGPGETISRAGSRQFAGSAGGGWHPWLSEPDVGRVADGIPARVDRLRSLGNSVVPQIPEIIGRAIMRAAT